MDGAPGGQHLCDFLLAFDRGGESGGVQDVAVGEFGGKGVLRLVGETAAPSAGRPGVSDLVAEFGEHLGHGVWLLDVQPVSAIFDWTARDLLLRRTRQPNGTSAGETELSVASTGRPGVAA